MCKSPSSQKKETAYEFRENNLFSVDGLCPSIRVSQMRRSVQRQLQGQELLLLGPVPLHGFRPAYLPGKPAGHPSLFAGTQSKLYHLGIRGKVSRNTLAHANQLRDWRIDADFAKILIGQARKLYAADSFGIELKQTVYALDSTTIDLCLSLFPWAKFRKRKGAVKMHTLLDLHGNIPSVVIVTPGNVHDVNILDDLIIEAGAIYIMDRGYLDFGRLFKIHQTPAFFVTRSKTNFSRKRLYSQPVDKSTGIQCDQIIALKGYYPKKHYPEKLRRIRYFDAENNKTLVFLTNNFVLPAITIADLYRCRWQVELFFKWIKQHLRIKAFYGTTENAVKTQIWIAISVYVLVAIVKKILKLDQSLYTILQILSVTLFEKMPILQALSNIDHKEQEAHINNQLNLFD
jgi:hypothetical protein